ncbi:MAG: RNA polymerase sigma-70 factor [Cyclobacteriaceae bacterium]|nr:RNA polymerase sigma-70 factor [Cyclobacteriaceae bacterium]
MEKAEPDIGKWIQKVAEEDCERSFRALYDHFFPRMYELANFYLKNHPSAGEVVGDVFYKCWKQRQSLGDIRDLQSYLLVSIKQQSLNYLRADRRNPLYISDVECESRLELNTPENELLNHELLDYLQKAIDALPEKCRLVFKFVKEDKLKYKETAHLLGISEKTVEMQMGIALKRIKESLEAYYEGGKVSGSMSKTRFLEMAYPIALMMLS